MAAPARPQATAVRRLSFGAKIVIVVPPGWRLVLVAARTLRELLTLIQPLLQVAGMSRSYDEIPA
jgi:hypothetical protein